MDVNGRIRQLMKERSWSEYRLAKMSGLSASTLSNLFTRNTTPSIGTLEAICKGFGITLGQFLQKGRWWSCQGTRRNFSMNGLHLPLMKKNC